MPASRFANVPYSARAKEHDAEITAAAKALEAALDKLPASREKSIALTDLEQSVMWGRKALRDIA